MLGFLHQTCLQARHVLCLQARHLLCLQPRHLLCQQTRDLQSAKTSPPHCPHRGGREAAAPVSTMPRGCLGRLQISCLLTQQTSWLLTQMSWLQRQQMSWLQTSMRLTGRLCSSHRSTVLLPQEHCGRSTGACGPPASPGAARAIFFHVLKCRNSTLVKNFGLSMAEDGFIIPKRLG